MEIAAAADPLQLHLYGACTDSKRWRETLAVPCTETGALSATLQAIHLRRSEVRVYWTAHGGLRDSATTPSCPIRRIRSFNERLQAAVGGLVGDEYLLTCAERPLARQLQAQLVGIGLRRFLAA